MDLFQVIEELRRPWLEEEELKAKFLRLSTPVHPDRFHGSTSPEAVEAGKRYVDLNTAYQTLRSARSRLLHLLELESGQRPADIQRIPPGTFDLFVEIGQMCRDVDAFLSKRAAVTSPMLKVGLFQEGLQWTERIKDLQGRVGQKAQALEQELREMNVHWEKAPAVGIPGRAESLPLPRVEEMYRILSYTTRWNGQLQERMVQLMMG